MELEFTDFVRKPFTVEALVVTEENLDEIAKYVGTIQEKENGTRYIQVDRRLVPNIFRVFPGFWMTRMGDNIRCYSSKIFIDQFIQTTPEITEWVSYMNAKAKENVVAPVEEENSQGSILG